MPRRGFAGGARPTTIANNVSQNTDFFVLASTQGWSFDGLPFVVVLDRGQPNEEKVLCSGISGDTVVVATNGRGYDDTLPADHSVGSPIRHVLSSDVVEETNAHVNDAARDDHTQYLKTADVAPSTYRHVQSIPLATWTIVHHLGFRPNLTVMDSAGNVVEGNIVHLDSNQLTVTFSAPFGGEASLS